MTTELPSFGVAFYGVTSIACLGMIIMFGFFQYMLLIMSGARSMGDQVMQQFWDSGIYLLMTLVAMTLTSIILWSSCLIRVAMVLFPQYGINQIKTIYFTSEDTEANYGVLMSAYGLENVVGLGCLILAPMLVFQGYSTCKAEKNYVLKDRPTTIAQFCVLALKHLDDDDFGQLQEKAQEQKSSRINKNHVGDIASKETFKKRKLASQKVAVLFQELGYTVGRVLDENDEDEDLSLSLKDTHEVKAMTEMKHFIKEFNQLNWDRIVENKDGKLPSLSLRESACLHRLHNELYGKL